VTADSPRGAQRRGRRIAMTTDERDAFLAAERTCRVASVGPEGPHVTPLWFAWDGTCLWLTSVVQSQRFADLRRDGRVSVVVDAGHDFMELRGVEIRGTAEAVGEVPRTGEPVAELDEPERIFAAKYADGRMRHDGRHAWLRITPHKVVSWDFRKMREMT
jgi:nitroimidazol reductase NimA-like FMN-containing flavoprotein (pyridoxamine 5'-phosphate oxidase superfamily)